MQFQMNKTLAYSPWQRWRWQLRLKIGRYFNSFIDPVAAVELAERRAYVNIARSPGYRLTDAQISSLSAWMLSVQDRAIRQEYFRTTPLERTFQGLVVPLVEEVLKRDRSVRHVMNIGANYAYIDHVLASRHPQVQFTAVDFAPNLDGYNAEFKRDNLRFVSGYALDLLERAEVKPDLVFFCCTLYEIKNAEIRRYLQLLGDLGCYVVINEPLYLLPGGGVVDPDSVPPTESRPVYSLPSPIPGKFGPVALVHNYRALVEENGYRLLHYRGFQPEFTNLRMVQVVAEKGRQPVIAAPANAALSA
jgi:hypothetical protein